MSKTSRTHKHGYMVALPARLRAHPSVHPGTVDRVHLSVIKLFNDRIILSPLHCLGSAPIGSALQHDHAGAPSSQRCWGNVSCKPAALVRQGFHRPPHPPLPRSTRWRDHGAASPARIPDGLGLKTEPRNRRLAASRKGRKRQGKTEA